MIIARHSSYCRLMDRNHRIWWTASAPSSGRAHRGQIRWSRCGWNDGWLQRTGPGRFRLYYPLRAVLRRSLRRQAVVRALGRNARFPARHNGRLAPRLRGASFTGRICLDKCARRCDWRGGSVREIRAVARLDFRILLSGVRPDLPPAGRPQHQARSCRS